MGREYARRIESPFQEVELKLPEQEPSTPQEYREAIRAYLNNGSLRGAKKVAAEGHSRFPDNPELERLNRLLTLSPARTVPGKNVNREKAFRWLDENETHYRGQWVALTDDGFLTSAPTLKELLRKIEAFGLDDPPLVHHIH
jgi:hypothetical protein